jgi:hypothetical protein
MFGAVVEVPAKDMCWVDLEHTEAGVWTIPVSALNVFIHGAAEIAACPTAPVEAYPGVNQTRLRDPPSLRPCLFCTEKLDVKRMLDHVALHVKAGDKLSDPAHLGGAEACGYCGRTIGICSTTLIRQTVNSNCMYKYSFKYKTAKQKRRNIPQPCPVHMCIATPFTLNIHHHLQAKHPGTALDDLDLRDWEVREQTPVRVRGESGRKTTLKNMPARITVKVHTAMQAASSATSSSEGAAAGSDFEWLASSTSADSDVSARSPMRTRGVGAAKQDENSPPLPHCADSESDSSCDSSSASGSDSESDPSDSDSSHSESDSSESSDGEGSSASGVEVKGTGRSKKFHKGKGTRTALVGDEKAKKSGDKRMLEHQKDADGRPPSKRAKAPKTTGTGK